MKIQEYPQRVLRVECVFELERNARHPLHGRPLLGPIAALMTIPPQIKEEAPTRRACFSGGFRTFHEKSRSERYLTKSDVTLKSQNVVGRPINTR